MSDVLVKVENVSKKFCKSLKRSMLYGTWDALTATAGIKQNNSKLRSKEFWALENINFELKRGESLGIIGPNGCGKTTLLRLLNGIFVPDAGKITVKGNMGALIAVGAGFHPQMSGKENIYLNGSILGMSKKEIDQKFDEIVAFSEIEDFLEAPVATYSAGMKVKLGFSIAIHGNPEIMLIDEILSVGDLAFRNKSLRKMAEYRQMANALIFVSHQLEQVRNLCNRVIVIDKGKIIFDGAPEAGISVYEETCRSIRFDRFGERYKNLRFGAFTDDIETTDVSFLNSNKEPVETIFTDEPLVVCLKFKILKYIEEIYFSVSLLNDNDNNCIWVMSNDFKKEQFTNISPGQYKLIMQIDQHHLNPGVYYLNYAYRNAKTHETYEQILSRICIRIASHGDTKERGIVSVNEKWNLIEEQ